MRALDFIIHPWWPPGGCFKAQTELRLICIRLIEPKMCMPRKARWETFSFYLELSRHLCILDCHCVDYYVRVFESLESTGKECTFPKHTDIFEIVNVVF